MTNYKGAALVRILFFGDLVGADGVPSVRPSGEVVKMLRGNPKLNVTVNKKFSEKSTPNQDGDEIALVGFSVI